MTETEGRISIGRRFGRYTLVRPIGRGGMAEVWKARIHGAQNFQRLVVVKRILPHLCLDPELVAMFTAEALLSAQLNHANIVQVFEFAENDGELYLAMEYVHGVNLAELLKRLDGFPIPVGMAAYLVREVALALAYAHGAKDEDGRPLSIIHRDVSPSNVMLGYDGTVKLVDFGVAMAQSPGADTRAVGADLRSNLQSLKGKVAYMSPEALQGEADLDGRTDIFATGVLLYELLTARRLFRAQDDRQTMALVRACKVRPPSRLRPDVPPELDRMVIRALARDRRARYATAAALATELTTVAAGCGWDRLATSAFLDERGIHPALDLSARGAAAPDDTVRARSATETKRITVVERRLRSGGSLPSSGARRRLRWALTGAAAALALSGALALGLSLRLGGRPVTPAVDPPEPRSDPGNGPGNTLGVGAPVAPSRHRVHANPYMMAPEVDCRWGSKSSRQLRNFWRRSGRMGPIWSIPPSPAAATCGPSSNSS